jgi:inner membrane protein
MASVGHIAMGMAAARVYGDGPALPWRSLAFWSALSLLPDADVIGFALGVEYADPWGHRGATHSLVMSAALGLVVGVAARRFNRPAGRTALVATLVLSSHAVLDTMTDGGLGCALFWPFDSTRYFAPWRPIPVAPIGLAFVSPHGGLIALTELVLFGPALLYAARSRPLLATPVTSGVVLSIWVIALWLISSGDPIREGVVGFALREDTAYTRGFSEGAFRTIEPGASESAVEQLLGQPVSQTWFYSPKGQPFQSAATRSSSSFPQECLSVGFAAGVVTTAFDREACRKIGIETGMSAIDVKRLLGPASEACWRYSWSPRNRHYRMRVVCFLDGRVESVIRRWE